LLITIIYDALDIFFFEFQNPCYYAGELGSSLVTRNKVQERNC
jgi:hypothetical protein